jgi:uncharacterized protein YggE
VAAGCGAAARPPHASSASPTQAGSEAAPQAGPQAAPLGASESGPQTGVSPPVVSAGLVDQTTDPGQTPPSSTPIVTTTGSGSASGTPAVMTMSIGVDTTAEHAGDALSESSVKATAVQQALRADGVAATDIQTSDLSLSPSYDNNSSSPTGYQATNNVVAKLRDLSKAGKVIDDAVAAAGDAGRLEGVTFSLDDSSAFATEARKIAVAQARSRADELAAAAGMKVAGLRSLSEDADPTPYEPFSGVAVPAAAPTSGVASVPIQPGVEETTVNVTAIWNLAPA